MHTIIAALALSGLAGVQQSALEDRLNEHPSAASLAATHELLTAEPHPAGTDADQRQIERLLQMHRDNGLDCRREDFFPYLPRPVSASLTVQHGAAAPIDLPIQESALEEDPFSASAEIDHGWNAYSGSGVASGRVVYANYGTREDFEQLATLGIEVRGAIVIARYGRNFRGFKAKFAEYAGAAALVIYTDPQDGGYTRGATWPRGGWASIEHIQRGSIKTVPWPGDPLTPRRPATRNAMRLKPDAVGLPAIPVQPVGWIAAREIMQRMDGPIVPEAWQGGGPFTYRLTGGDDLTATVSVEQSRGFAASANVIATIPGARWPEQKVIVGCHFDAWTFGASDPHAGSIIVAEMAASFAASAADGLRPARTVVFAHWGAEEHGIIGSTEWCEAHHDELSEHAVAYINLDMAAMGPHFGSSSAPLLKTVIEQAAASTRAVDGSSTVAAAWVGEREEAPFGDLGGGSDHVGFYCHLGVPAAGIGARGAAGTAYHSAHDTLTWYRRIVGDDYGPALMLTRLCNRLVARLANEPLLPLDPTRYARDSRQHLATIGELAVGRGTTLPSLAALHEQIDRFERVAIRVRTAGLAAVAAGELDDSTLAAVNRGLLRLERTWLDPDGLSGRSWYRSLYAATDPDSGYGAWMLPLLRGAVEADRPDAAAAAADRYRGVFERLAGELATIERLLQVSPSPQTP